MKGKALRKNSLHEKTAASVLLKLLLVVINDATPLNQALRKSPLNEK